MMICQLDCLPGLTLKASRRVNRDQRRGWRCYYTTPALPGCMLVGQGPTRSQADLTSMLGETVVALYADPADCGEQGPGAGMPELQGLGLSWKLSIFRARSEETPTFTWRAIQDLCLARTFHHPNNVAPAVSNRIWQFKALNEGGKNDGKKATQTPRLVSRLSVPGSLGSPRVPPTMKP